MDHQDVLEQLELAATEPGGLERLMAGDTPVAASVAGHLAGCPTCTDELERLRRAAPLLRDVVQTTPPPELRQRTLDHVRVHGVARGTETLIGGAPTASDTASSVVPERDHRARRIVPWVAAIAAAVVISVIASTVIVSDRLDAQVASRDRVIAGLEAVTTATLALTSEPDVERVALTPTGPTDAAGTLLFSPSTTQLVVVASGLEPAPTGQEYRCWVLIDGQRTDVGRMNPGGDVSYWVGVTPEVGSVPDGTTFGVSLTSLDGSDAGADPVIAGDL
jgi:Anti-sigma-K factor rskA, C-terminal